MLAQISWELARVLHPYLDKINVYDKDSKSVVERPQRIRATEKIILSTYDIEACYLAIDIMDGFNEVQQNIPLRNSGSSTRAKLRAVAVNNIFITANGTYLTNILEEPVQTRSPHHLQIFIYFINLKKYWTKNQYIFNIDLLTTVCCLSRMKRVQIAFWKASMTVQT